jgi:hypothetical protein
MAAFVLACPQGWRPAAVFYPFGHPTPYAYEWIFKFGIGSIFAHYLEKFLTRLKNSFVGI